MRAKSQSEYTISGRVTNEKQKPISGAIVFIDGSQIATATDNIGRFEVNAPGPGSYHLLVKMMGYAVVSKDVMLTGKSINLDISLTIKPIILHEVNIGSDKNWAKNYAIFKKEFLGTTVNARACEILNPEIINFSTSKRMLYADADDFLMIENKKLGYRIKYLLKTFEHSALARTSYSGDVIFEELAGTEYQKQEWAKNRLETYNGSMMHFLRAVFNNVTLNEGFVTNQMYQSNGKHYYNPNPIKFDTLVTAINTSFVSFKFTGLRIVYDPVKATALMASDHTAAANSHIIMEDISAPEKTASESELILSLKGGAVVDAAGRVFSGYLRSFLIRGAWTYKRVGDQLPFEYQPPVITFTKP
ncbi:hypothetical protein GCM10022392_23260 [Mucilaginibacter panaciglaebae]|uniref:Carboxypeptidase-like regulatory domain-containing protein n=2 Tax=Mucilaginibacter panaciglaebae TaxID=502331 RepID=A0ABP7WWP5_9SPHI